MKPHTAHSTGYHDWAALTEDLSRACWPTDSHWFPWRSLLSTAVTTQIWCGHSYIYHGSRASYPPCQYPMLGACAVVTNAGAGTAASCGDTCPGGTNVCLSAEGRASVNASTKSADSMFLSSLCATPPIYRMGIVIGIPPTQPLFVGAPRSSLIFVDIRWFLAIFMNSHEILQISVDFVSLVS